MVASARHTRPVFACQECGHETPRWAGRCPACESWNTLAQVCGERVAGNGAGAVAVSSVALAEEPRIPLGLPEFDRVLGGGAVPGSVVLVGGDPGIGKSTLLLQAAALAAGAGRTVLYVSGEESARQVAMRAARLGLAGERLFLLAETSLDAALAEAQALAPQLVVVDSIQTMQTEAVPQTAGSVLQIRQCTTQLMRWAKGTGTPVFIVGHVTKDGEIAGPRLLEHIVDAVLYLEGERFSHYRLLRGVKNRFGSTDEVGVFEMTGAGLEAVENPSHLFMAERATGAPGSVVLPTLEGSRPLLVEVQALTSPSATPAPRRTANGLDFNRLLLVAAVVSRRLGLPLANQDVMASVVGGLRVCEPASDLALALAIVSSYRDRPFPTDMVALGEIGLAGELRPVGRVELRLAEARRLGFRRCVLPETNARRLGSAPGLELRPVASLREAVRLALDA